MTSHLRRESHRQRSQILKIHFRIPEKCRQVQTRKDPVLRWDSMSSINKGPLIIDKNSNFCRLLLKRRDFDVHLCMRTILPKLAKWNKRETTWWIESNRCFIQLIYLNFLRRIISLRDRSVHSSQRLLAYQWRLGRVSFRSWRVRTQDRVLLKSDMGHLW